MVSLGVCPRLLLEFVKAACLTFPFILTVHSCALTRINPHIMLFQSIIGALAASLILEVRSSPVTLEHHEIRMKREVPSSHRLHERHLDHWSQQWTKRSKVSDTQILPMRIGLKQYNIEAGYDKLMDM